MIIQNFDINHSEIQSVKKEDEENHDFLYIYACSNIIDDILKRNFTEPELAGAKL